MYMPMSNCTPMSKVVSGIMTSVVAGVVACALVLFIGLLSGPANAGALSAPDSARTAKTLHGDAPAPMRLAQSSNRGSSARRSHGGGPGFLRQFRVLKQFRRHHRARRNSHSRRRHFRRASRNTHAGGKGHARRGSHRRRASRNHHAGGKGHSRRGSHRRRASRNHNAGKGHSRRRSHYRRASTDKRPRHRRRASRGWHPGADVAVPVPAPRPWPRKRIRRGTPARDIAPRPVPRAVAAARLPRLRDDEVLVLLENTQSPGVVQDLATRHRLEALSSQPVALLNARVQRFRIQGNRRLSAVLADLAADARVSLVQPNYLYRLQGEGLGADAQYALAKLDIPKAHKISQGRNVLVAVIDSGIEMRHPAFAEAISDSFDAVEEGDFASDAHGTAVAGVIAARGEMMGIAPASQLLAIRAFTMNRKVKAAETTSFTLLRAMSYAQEKGARIFNMSFAGPRDPLVERAVKKVQDAGAIIVAAAGNDGPRAKPAYPAAYDGVIAITATDADDKLYSKANRGAYVTVAAPGVDILVPVSKNGYSFTTGTSIAAAHVSGMIALMMEMNAKLGAGEARDALIAAAHDLGPKGRDKLYGAGLIDAAATLAMVGGDGQGGDGESDDGEGLASARKSR